ncbi:MAG: RNA-binding protein [Bacteroidales bacterium]|nr:RNA-binding protein [Bacteroidales bacterium]MDD4670175.1 RNA-binding protein [Bacteroidales bacterium]
MNIFISNLSYSVKEADLQKAFEQYGEVQLVKIITDKFTGRSKGFGFVEMSDENGQAAIDALNGTTFFDRELKVAVARPKEEREDRRDRGYGRNDRRSDNRRY